MGVVPVDAILQIPPQIKKKMGGGWNAETTRVFIYGWEVLVQPLQRDICCRSGVPSEPWLHLCHNSWENLVRPSFWHLRTDFFRLLPTESLAVAMFSGDLKVGFLPTLTAGDVLCC